MQRRTCTSWTSKAGEHSQQILAQGCWPIVTSPFGWAVGSRWHRCETFKPSGPRTVRGVVIVIGSAALSPPPCLATTAAAAGCELQSDCCHCCCCCCCCCPGREQRGDSVRQGRRVLVHTRLHLTGLGLPSLRGGPDAVRELAALRAAHRHRESDQKPPRGFERSVSGAVPSRLPGGFAGFVGLREMQLIIPFVATRSSSGHTVDRRSNLCRTPHAHPLLPITA